jgi:ABC-type uncharacterized transport system permease subunit
MAGQPGLEQRIPTGLSVTQSRKFGLTVGAAFLVLGGILLWRQRESGAAVTGTIGVLLILLGAVAPGVLVPVERAWMKLSHVMSAITTPIIMAVIYFFVLTPIAVLMRALGRNPLLHAGNDKTLWVSRATDKERRGGMDRQF